MCAMPFEHFSPTADPPATDTMQQIREQLDDIAAHHFGFTESVAMRALREQCRVMSGGVHSIQDIDTLHSSYFKAGNEIYENPAVSHSEHRLAVGQGYLAASALLYIDSRQYHTALRSLDEVLANMVIDREDEATVDTVESLHSQIVATILRRH